MVKGDSENNPKTATFIQTNFEVIDAATKP